MRFVGSPLDTVNMNGHHLSKTFPPREEIDFMPRCNPPGIDRPKRPGRPVARVLPITAWPVIAVVVSALMPATRVSFGADPVGLEVRRLVVPKETPNDVVAVIRSIEVSGAETGGNNVRAATVAFNGQTFYSSAKTSPVGIY